jgi:hypothetical protein
MRIGAGAAEAKSDPARSAAAKIAPLAAIRTQEIHF